MKKTSASTSPNTNAQATINPSESSFDKLIDYLWWRILWLKIQGFLALAVTGVIVYCLMKKYWLTHEQVKSLLSDAAGQEVSSITEGISKKPGYASYMLLYLIFRNSTLGVITTTIIYFGGKIAIASFDQATRFTKRKMGTLFLSFLYVKHGNDINRDISLEQFMHYFESWNKTIESAFSSIKPEKTADLTEANKQLAEAASKIVDLATKVRDLSEGKPEPKRPSIKEDTSE